jgi:site-specific DNA-cytosine methylase
MMNGRFFLPSDDNNLSLKDSLLSQTMNTPSTIHAVPPHFAKRPKPVLPPDAPTLVTAFTCGGLFDIGALHAGFRPVLGVEFYPAKNKKDDKVKQRQSAAAADNYERNFGSHIIRKSIEEAVRDRAFTSHVQQHGKPNAFHCSPSCTNLSQGNTKGSEDAGDLSAAQAITDAIAQLDFPEIFTLENVEAYQKSASWRIIRDFLYAHGYGVAEDVVMASDYGNLEAGEGVPQDRKRLIVRAVRGHFAPPLPPKVPQRMGWLCAIADLIEDLPDGELAPWQLQRLPELVKDLLVDPNNPSRNYTVKETSEPSFTIAASHTRRPITTPCAYLVRNDNTKQEWGKGYREGEEPSVTVTATYIPSAVLLNGQNASNKEVPHKQGDEPAFSVTAGTKWASALLIERAGASDERITTRTPDEPSWTLRSSIGTDQDGRNRNEVMNAVVGGRVKKLNARAIARLQSVPDWYTLPAEMKFAGPLLGNGVPCLLAEAIMRSLLPFVQNSEKPLNGLRTSAEDSLPVHSEFTDNSVRVQPEFSLNSGCGQGEPMWMESQGANLEQYETLVPTLNGLRIFTEDSLNIQPQCIVNSACIQAEFSVSSDRVQSEVSLIPYLNPVVNHDERNQPLALQASDESSVDAEGNTLEPHQGKSRRDERGTGRFSLSTGGEVGRSQGEEYVSKSDGDRWVVPFQERRLVSGSEVSSNQITEGNEMIALHVVEDEQTEIASVEDDRDEQYTPNTKLQPVINLVTEALGGRIGIDVTADANKSVPAEHHCTKEDNYLSLPLDGMALTGFMNPPYSNPLPFLSKFVSDYEQGFLTAGITLLKVGAAHNKGTGKLIKSYASAQCQWGVNVRRIGFIKNGKQRHGADFDCTLIYFGKDIQKFQEVFEPYGLVGILPVGQKILREQEWCQNVTIPLKVDPEFLNLIPPLSADERKLLEESILAEGVRESIKVWNGDIIIDGHNRYAIALANNLPYRIEEIDLPDREAVKSWMINHQLGRRNLRPDWQAYLRGQLYNRVKSTPGGSGANQFQEKGVRQTTSVQLAQQWGISKRTLLRDSKFAEDLDFLATELGEDVRAMALTEGTLTKKDINALRAIALVDSNKAKQELALFKKKDVVAEVKNRKVQPDDLSHWVGSIVIINGYGKDSKGKSLKPFAGQWAVVVDVREYHVIVALDEDRLIEPKFLEEAPEQFHAALKVLRDHIAVLEQCELDAADVAFLEFMKRTLNPTPRQYLLLERTERDYGIGVDSCPEVLAATLG